MNESLESLRKSIEKMDHEILQMIHERMLLSNKLGKLKKEMELPVQYPAIESEVKKRYSHFGSQNNVSVDFCESLAKIILEESVRIQKNK